MIEVPEAMLVITPVDASIVATLGVDELHEPPDTVELKVVPVPKHAIGVPLKVPALMPVTVTVLTSLTSAHPPVPVTV